VIEQIESFVKDTHLAIEERAPPAAEVAEDAAELIIRKKGRLVSNPKIRNQKS
jgi:hypothetical protein